MASAREARQIYEETQREGRRRLTRPLPELAATALVGGFDVAFGIAANGLADSLGVRIVMAWVTGALIVLGAFNHAIVSTPTVLTRL